MKIAILLAALLGSSVLHAQAPTVEQRGLETQGLLVSLCASLQLTPPALQSPAVKALCPPSLPPGTTFTVADPAVIAALLAIEAKQDAEIAAIKTSHATLDAFLKGLAKYVAGPLGAAILTYLGTH